MNKQTQEAFEIIKKFSVSGSGIVPEKNRAARIATKKFLEKVKDIKTKPYYTTISVYQLLYAEFLLSIRKSLKEENYISVCNELEALICWYPLTNEHVKQMVIKILEEYS